MLSLCLELWCTQNTLMHINKYESHPKAIEKERKCARLSWLVITSGECFLFRSQGGVKIVDKKGQVRAVVIKFKAIEF